MFFFMEVFEKGRLELIFPIKVRERGRGGLFVVAVKVGVVWLVHCRALVWVMNSFISLFTKSMDKRYF
jgi:hypothetical protein